MAKPCPIARSISRLACSEYGILLLGSTIPEPAVTVWSGAPVRYCGGTTPVVTRVAAACDGKIGGGPPGLGGPGVSWFRTHVAVSAPSRIPGRVSPGMVLGRCGWVMKRNDKL